MSRRRQGLRLLAVSIAFGVTSSGCHRHPSQSEGERALPSAEEAQLSTASATARVPPSPPDEAQRRVAERAACLERIQAARQKPPVAGAPALDAVRLTLLARVKAEPLLFLEPPALEAVSDPGILSYQRWLSRTRHPSSVLAQLFAQLLGRPLELRRVLLKSGYLYADTLPLAEALVRDVRPEQLFEEPEIWVQRGERVFVAERAGRVYRYRDGLEKGRVVRLLLFDRVGVGPVPRPLHLDLRSLRYRLGFDSLRALHLTHDELVAEVGYGGRWVPSRFEMQGARLALECEAPAPGSEEVVGAWRAERLQGVRAFRSVQHAIALQIDDHLPFDEPKHEEGQEDGKLRPLWLRAYSAGRATYQHHDDEYLVFDARGRPQVPEVCVDFLLDTLERASGTWWRRKGEPRERVRGRLDFDGFDREALRRVPGLLELAYANPSWLEVLEIPAQEQIAMGKRGFFEYLALRHQDFRVGDMILVGGYVPWDLRKYVHYHSFFVFESDPLSGMPLLIAGNPGYPRLVPWSWEAARTPRRSLRYRLRPKAEWLASAVEPWTPTQVDPPSLSYAPE